MAEQTEQEQLKTNQLLTIVESSAAETSHKMEELISAVKQPATYETDLLKEIKDQGEDQAQTDKKTLKSQREFHQEIKELTRIPINVQSGGIIFAEQSSHKSIVDLKYINTITIRLTD